MGQPRRCADRPSAPRGLTARVSKGEVPMAPPVILLTGFEPFGGESENPSWEVARRFDRIPVDGAIVRAFELPVALKPAIRMIAGLIARLDPAVVLGLGQAGGRPTVTVERVAVNLFSEDEAGGRS